MCFRLLILVCLLFVFNLPLSHAQEGLKPDDLSSMPPSKSLQAAQIRPSSSLFQQQVQSFGILILRTNPNIQKKSGVIAEIDLGTDSASLHMANKYLETVKSAKHSVADVLNLFLRSGFQVHSMDLRAQEEPGVGMVNIYSFLIQKIR